MTIVFNLMPGDLVEQDEKSAVYVAQTEHPIWAHLRMVIWQLADGTWSHDALDPRQDVGDAVPSTPDVRLSRLRAVLLREVLPNGCPPTIAGEKWAVMSRQQRRAARRRANL